VQHITLGEPARGPGRKDAHPKRRTSAAEAHHRIRMPARGDRHPVTGKITKRQFALLIARWGTELVGSDPHLDEVDRLGRTVRIDSVAVVALRVHDARACAHPLRQPGIDQPRVAVGVFVNE
jgi:hypothetical protein